MRKLMHIITTIDRGGAEKQLLLMIEAQIKLGYRVVVIPLKGNNELLPDFEGLGAQVLDKCVNRSFIKSLLILSKLLRENKYHLVHAHLPRAELITALTFTSIPLVVTRHNSEPFFPQAPSWLSRMLSRYVADKAQKVVFISNASKNFAHASGEVVDNLKAEMIHYGSKAAKYMPRAVPIDSPLKIVTIGRLVNQKDLYTQIAAIAELPKGRVKLLIYGEGPDRSGLQSEIDRLGISNTVFLKGKSSNIKSILMENDLFILSSRYEGFGLVLLEAVEYGIPILASKIATTTEVLGEDFQYTFEVGDFKQLAFLINRFDELREYDFSIYQKCLERFRINETAKKYDKVYESIVTKGIA